MPYKDPEFLKAYKAAHARRPEQKAKHALRRQQPWYAEYMTPLRRKNVLQRYGLTPESYVALLQKQGCRCAICGADKPGNGVGDKNFDVDHCHETGKVRGLLCRKCNVTAGVLEKNRDRIALIEEYLKAHPK
jgi:hypothetical protein